MYSQPLSTSGSYTPTNPGVNTNITTVTPGIARWSRVGNTVEVSGLVTVAPTGAADTQFVLSLPITSVLAASTDLSGVAAAQSGAIIAVAIYGDTVTGGAMFSFNAPAATSRAYRFTFSYTVI